MAARTNSWTGRCLENNTMQECWTQIYGCVLQSKFRHDLRLGASEAGMLTRHMYMLAKTATSSALEHRYNTTHVLWLPSFIYGPWLPWRLHTVHAVMLVWREILYHIIQYCVWLLTVLLLFIKLSLTANITLKKRPNQQWFSSSPPCLWHSQQACSYFLGPKGLLCSKCSFHFKM